MNIGYARLSGGIGVSAHEQGTRGMWWEKRRALLAFLTNELNHQVFFAGKLTKESIAAGYQTNPYCNYDTLIVEFGGLNERFYAKDIAATKQLIDKHKGRKIFLCDDPDLIWPWKVLGLDGKNLFDWDIWVNASPAACFREELIPTGAKCFYMPFSTLVAINCYQKPVSDKFVEKICYIGRPDGRKKQFDAIIPAAAQYLAVFGNAKEWRDYDINVQKAPLQVEREAFYSSYLACLAVCDKKHDKLEWRTGRAYHAIIAGTPVLSTHSNPALKWTLRYTNAVELCDHYWNLKNPTTRCDVVQLQQNLVNKDLEQVLDVMKECNL